MYGFFIIFDSIRLTLFQFLGSVIMFQITRVENSCRVLYGSSYAATARYVRRG